MEILEEDTRQGGEAESDLGFGGYDDDELTDSLVSWQADSTCKILPITCSH